MSEYKLTAFSKGAGCGCKIGPGILDKILAALPAQPADAALLVGYRERDDAAVYRLDEQVALVSTTDFFTPIVDDAATFGRIAAANALSDVYAMGGRPLLAIAVLGWPVGQLPPELAGAVLAGARETCTEAGIPLAGGHSIEAPEPFFGLSVTGTVRTDHIKRNHTGQAGDLVLLTKPIGSGVLTTALKRGLLAADHLDGLVSHLTQLNQVGAELGSLEAVTAMTDVTGFGLLGHLSELTAGGGTGVELHYGKVPRMQGVPEYLRQQVMPDATSRNWARYGGQVQFAEGVDVLDAYLTLSDPQTNGGLLLTVRPEQLAEVVAVLTAAGLSAHTEPIGRLTEGPADAAGIIRILP